MFSCGMYDYSGGWTYEVGIPAKSGVGGGILGVVNRQLGIGTYSPRLDRNGNSVRGIASFKMMSNVLGLHAFDLTNTGSAFVNSFFEPGAPVSWQSDRSKRIPLASSRHPPLSGARKIQGGTNAFGAN